MRSFTEKLVTRIKQSFPDKKTVSRAYDVGSRAWIQPLIELAVLGFASMWIAQEYMALDSRVVPAGREFLSTIQANDFWLAVKRCGWCALWNGSVAGGYPALAEIYGAPLHPLVAVTTLRWGVINGAKIAVIAMLAMAGIAQWWLAKVLKVGWIPRMWSALVAVAGGHLAGRMQLGLFGIVLSTASASLVIPALVALSRQDRSRRNVVLLGVTLALMIVAGQGYMQVGFLFMLPALFVLILDRNLRLRDVWKDYARGGLLGLLFAGPLLVPLLHFLPQVGKWQDPGLESLQPLKYLPLNLVIDDPNFYFASDILGKLPYPNLYTLFIGWPAVLLAVFGLVQARRRATREILFMAVGTGLVFLTASGVLLRWAGEIYPRITGVRYASLIAGLAVPMILGVASVGLDQLLKLDWPSLELTQSLEEGSRIFSLSLRWILVVPLVLALRSNFSFASSWMGTVRLDPTVHAVLDAMKTEHLTWVDPPFGEHIFIAPGLERQLKLAQGVKPWSWKDRDDPEARIVAGRGERPEFESFAVLDTIKDLWVVERKNVYYAAVHANGEVYPCTAQGFMGRISVTCEAGASGELIVQEHRWPGWRVWRDGRETSLEPRQWLVVDAPSGSHDYQFRYLPVDVPLGCGLFVV
ncbi:MAG: hypothetical protein R3191_07730, partial [Anaerolineales bacterium]|nr:hypothetical protein [Anaerolineales bacterium]